MPHAFLTGLTGFLGHHIADVLGEQGWQVTAMVRNTDAAAALHGGTAGLTLVAGDLTRPESVRAAMPRGIDAVFHAAADTSSWARDAARQLAVNIGGTEAVISAARAQGAGRMVHVSSISVYGDQPGEITEDSPHLARTSWVAYARSKALAEEQIQAALAEGFDAVIVNPTHIIGRYDTQNWARMILKMIAGELPGAPPGAGNFADGRAVAEAVVTAWSKAPRGRSYILGGPHASMRAVMTEAAEQLGMAPPARTLPRWLLMALARAMNLGATLTGSRPRITPEEAYFASTQERASSARAVRELGYREVPIRQSLADCIDALRAAGLLASR